MNLTKYLAIALLLNISVTEVTAIRHHRRKHHHHKQQLAQAYEPDEEEKSSDAPKTKLTGDMVLDDYKVSALQKKKVKLQDRLAEKLATPELTEDEQKKKLNDDIDALAKQASQQSRVKKMETLSEKIENAKGKGEDTKAEQAMFDKIGQQVKQYESENEKQVQKKEEIKVDDEVEDIKIRLAKINKAQDAEKVVLNKVKDTLTKLVDPIPEFSTQKTTQAQKEGPDMSVYNANLKAMQEEEDKKEADEEARALKIKNIKPNPAIAIVDAAMERYEQASAVKRFVKKEEEEKAYDAERFAKASKISKSKHNTAELNDMDNVSGRGAMHTNGEVWTANMPEHIITDPDFDGYIQTKVNQIRQQLAAVDAREESGSDSDSDSDDE